MQTKRKTVRVEYVGTDKELHTVTLDAECGTLIGAVCEDGLEKWVQKQHDLVATGKIKEVKRVYGQTPLSPTKMGKIIRARAFSVVLEHCEDF